VMLPTMTLTLNKCEQLESCSEMEGVQGD